MTKAAVVFSDSRFWHLYVVRENDLPGFLERVDCI